MHKNKNKKGISEIVSYAILIVIAVSLSIMVYAFLRLYIPKEQVECKEDVRLVIKDYSCSVTAKQLNVTITNKGLFKADAAFIYFEDKDQKIKNQTNSDNPLLSSLDNSLTLNPGKSFNATYNLGQFEFNIREDGNYTLEILPAILSGKQIVACENAIISQPIKCY